MSGFERGDRVRVTEGTFAGGLGVVVEDAGLVGDDITVALADSGRVIDTSTGHVEAAEGWRSPVQTGESVIVAEGDFKGEQGVVVGDSGVLGQRIVVRLNSGREIDTKESHVSRCRPG